MGREDECESEDEDESEDDMSREVEDIDEGGEETGGIGEKEIEDWREKEIVDRAKEKKVEEEEMENGIEVAEEGRGSAIGALYYKLVDLADIIHYLDKQADMEQLEREGTMQPVEGALRRYLREVVKAYGRYTSLRNY